MVKVRAKKLCFCEGHRRRPKEEFVVKDPANVSEGSMIVLEDLSKASKKASTKDKPARTDSDDLG